MPRFTISNDAVKNQGNNLEISVDDLRRILERYRATVEAAIGTWYGLGSTTFKTFDTQFQPFAGNMITALSVMRGELDATDAAYTQDENEQQTAVTALNAAMPLGPIQPGGGGLINDIFDGNDSFGGKKSGGAEGPVNPDHYNGFGDSAVHTGRGAANAWFDSVQGLGEEAQGAANDAFDWAFNSESDGVVQDAWDAGNGLVDSAQNGVEAAQDTANDTFDWLFGSGDEDPKVISKGKDA